MNVKTAVTAKRKDTSILFLNEKRVNPRSDVVAELVAATTKFYLSHSCMLFQTMASFVKQYLVIMIL